MQLAAGYGGQVSKRVEDSAGRLTHTTQTHSTHTVHTHTQYTHTVHTQTHSTHRHTVYTNTNTHTCLDECSEAKPSQTKPGLCLDTFSRFCASRGLSPPYVANRPPRCFSEIVKSIPKSMIIPQISNIGKLARLLRSPSYQPHR